MKINPMLLCDFYKLSHRAQYPERIEKVYSTWTPRKSLLPGIDEVVAVGIKQTIRELIAKFNADFFSQDIQPIVDDYQRTLASTLGIENADVSHIEALHALGYLPIEFHVLPEGTVVPIGTPMMTMENTHPDFFWLTGYLETLLSTELWQMSTSATIAREFRKVLDDQAMETVGDVGFVGFQGHDFSMRGLSSLSSAIKSGMGHLLSFVGTDTIPAIQALEQCYKTDGDLVGTSIPATEHSVQCAYMDDELYLRRMITEVYPRGPVSIVSDGFDFWHVVTDILPKLKDVIMARGDDPLDKVVIRPDSGDPVKIICGDPGAVAGSPEHKGLIECLSEIFGTTLTPMGFYQLDTHIGAIYGDSITLDRVKIIGERLAKKGFASTNMVYGIGSYTYQYNTRDTFGFAMKCSQVQIKGEKKDIFKAPKTDTGGAKKSRKGRVTVLDRNNTGDLITLDEQLPGMNTGLLEFFNVADPLDTLADVRARVANR